MKRRRCSICARYLSRYFIAAPNGLACTRCGPKVDGGAIQRDAQRMLRQQAELILRRCFGVESAA